MSSIEKRIREVYMKKTAVGRSLSYCLEHPYPDLSKERENREEKFNQSFESIRKESHVLEVTRRSHGNPVLMSRRAFSIYRLYKQHDFAVDELVFVLYGHGRRDREFKKAGQGIMSVVGTVFSYLCSMDKTCPFRDVLQASWDEREAVS